MAKKERKMLIWVGALIEDSDGRFLFLKRQKGASVGKGLWQLPGGKMEWGESPLETLEREIMEETGMKVKNPELAGAYTSLVPTKKADWHTLLVVYRFRAGKQKVRISDEHDEFRWMNAREARRQKLFKDLDRFVEWVVKNRKGLNS
ncbi:MAG: NUDIX domain-containing protein [Candidatus Micrarchaeota archaeon]|nr:NUDIX domain-containing protein [Candidatus Micrarchaeota archaeon]